MSDHRPVWIKSSYSNPDGGSCVEWSPSTPGAVPVRDSKVPCGPVLAFPPTAWDFFVAAVKADGFGCF
ncbi:DUF397 domain-containing protein [Streptomyces sp. NPDC021093]|uniref:DUF397 domain-containing protein n=1 Tax=Streptomyces sp. NPDC021093 TaxID=3365112 RepID=UPI0037AF8D96